MRRLLVAVVVLVGCQSAGLRHTEGTRVRPEVEASIAAIRANAQDAIGFGDKAYVPWELRRGDDLARHADPAVTRRLAEEALDPRGDRVYRLALLHVLGRRDDAAADDALVAALGDERLRATAAYLIGRAGFKGYPKRPRDVPRLLAALRPWLDDATGFEDPWYGQRFRTGDFVLAAFIRLAGPERFGPVDEMIGYTLPHWRSDERARMLALARGL